MFEKIALTHDPRLSIYILDPVSILPYNFFS